MMRKDVSRGGEVQVKKFEKMMRKVLGGQRSKFKNPKK